jgi:hypothetical protein
MWALLQGLRYRAIAVAFFFCYLLPSLIVWLVLQIVMNVSPADVYGPLGIWSALFALWATFLGPFAAGYMVAWLAKVAPLAHGLAVSFTAGAIYVAILNAIPAAWLALFVAFLLLSGFCGAWFYRYRALGVTEL